MSFIEALSQAWESLKSNLLRSILTMLGIIMGVFSVIAILAIGNATESYIIGEFEKIGANTLEIQYKNSERTRNEYLLIEDMDFLAENISEIKNIASISNKWGTSIFENKTRDTMIYAVSSQYKSFAPLEFAHGRFINRFDNDARSLVCVVDEYFARRYFNKTDIIGETITVKIRRATKKIEVIGVTSAGDDIFSSLSDNEDFPAIIYMPLTTIQQLYSNQKALQSIMITVDKDEDIEALEKKILMLLEAKKNVKDSYMIQSSADMQQIFTKIIDVITLVLLVIAIITLFVGGIGIVNILLVSVTERIREIGIRKAIGATKKDIVIQFLTESIILTGTGGLIGILFGIIAGFIASKLVKIPAVVDIPVVLAAFFGSILLGLIFGVYPAKRAADLDPIESLRYE